MTLKQFDTSLTKLVARIPPSAHRAFAILGMLTTPLMWAIVLLLLVAIAQPRPLQAGLLVLAATPLATLIKFAFRRQRPPTIYAGNMRIKSYSFPSSHAYSSALSASYLAVLAAGHIGPAAYFLLVIPLIIGASRVHLGAHYPSDVIAGWLLGGLIVTGILLCV